MKKYLQPISIVLGALIFAFGYVFHSPVGTEPSAVVENTEEIEIAEYPKSINIPPIPVEVTVSEEGSLGASFNPYIFKIGDKVGNFTIIDGQPSAPLMSNFPQPLYELTLSGELVVQGKLLLSQTDIDQPTVQEIPREFAIKIPHPNDEELPDYLAITNDEILASADVHNGDLVEIVVTRLDISRRARDGYPEAAYISSIRPVR